MKRLPAAQSWGGGLRPLSAWMGGGGWSDVYFVVFVGRLLTRAHGPVFAISGKDLRENSPDIPSRERWFVPWKSHLAEKFVYSTDDISLVYQHQPRLLRRTVVNCSTKNG